MAGRDYKPRRSPSGARASVVLASSQGHATVKPYEAIAECSCAGQVCVEFWDVLGLDTSKGNNLIIGLHPRPSLLAQIWPVIARHFDMPVGEPQQVPLQDYMRDKQPTWEATVEKYGLSKEFDWSHLGTWQFAVSKPSLRRRAVCLAMLVMHRQQREVCVSAPSARPPDCRHMRDDVGTCTLTVLSTLPRLLWRACACSCVSFVVLQFCRSSCSSSRATGSPIPTSSSARASTR